MRQAGKSQPCLGPGWGGEDIGTDSQTDRQTDRQGDRKRGHSSLGQRPDGMVLGLGRELLVADPAGREPGFLAPCDPGSQAWASSGTASPGALAGVTSSPWHHRCLRSCRHSRSHCRPGCPAVQRCPFPCRSHQSVPCGSPYTYWCPSAGPQHHPFWLW